MKKFFYTAALVIAALVMTACGGANFSGLKKAIEEGDAEKAAQIAYDLEKKGVEFTEEENAELEAAMKEAGISFVFEFMAAEAALMEESEAE